MSILIMCDGKSKEQTEKLKKISLLLDTEQIYLSGYNKRSNLKGPYKYIEINSHDYIDKLIHCEIIILLSEKISLTKFNRSQTIISWFDIEIMENNFVFLQNNEKINFLNKYHLDVMIGTDNHFNLIDTFSNKEYAAIKRYINNTDYKLNLFVFDLNIYDENSIAMNDDFNKLIKDRYSVNLLLHKGNHSQFFISNFDYTGNHNELLKEYLVKKLNIGYINKLYIKNINIINKEFSKTFTLESKKDLYLKELESSSVSNTQPLVSIVVPHYNTEQALLFRAIDSVLANKYKNVEIIIVDDGSKTKLTQIMPRRYTRNDKIKIIRKNNEGLGLARNTGIKSASGKYIFLVDSDDTITHDGLYYLVAHAEKYKIDMVSGIVAIVDDNGIPINLSMHNLHGYTYERYSSKDQHQVFYSQMVHGKLLKKSLFVKNGIWFKSGLYEDGPWSAELYGKLNRFDFINIVSNHWYKYEQRETLSSTATLNNFKERYRVYLEVVKICDKKTIFQKTNFFLKHELSMYFENYEYFTPDEKKDFFVLLIDFVKTKGEFLDPNSVIYYRKMIEAIEFNNFNRFNNIIEMHFGKTLSNEKKYDNYIALTHYGLMVSIVYTLKNKNPSRLYLNTGYVTFDHKLITNLEKTGLFTQIVVFENKESGKLIEQLGNASKDPKYVIPDILYTPYKKIFSDIKPMEDVYVFNSTLPYWYYIERTNKNIIKLEDGYNSIANEINQMSKYGVYFDLLEEHIPTIYPDAALYLAKKIIISKEYDKLPNKLRGKVSIVDTKELIKNHEDKYKSILKSIYPFEDTGSKNACLILTQPLDKVLYCTTEEKSKLYRKMIKEHKQLGPVYIKPHPADDYPYSNWRGVRVLDKDIPSEVYDLTGFKCDTAVTFGSTAINTIGFAKNMITIYQDNDTSREKVKLKIQEYISNYKDKDILKWHKGKSKLKKMFRKLSDA